MLFFIFNNVYDFFFAGFVKFIQDTMFSVETIIMWRMYWHHVRLGCVINIKTLQKLSYFRELLSKLLKSKISIDGLLFSSVFANFSSLFIATGLFRFWARPKTKVIFRTTLLLQKAIVQSDINELGPFIK